MSSQKPINRSALIIFAVIVIAGGGGFAAWKYFDTPPLSRYDAVLKQMSIRQIDSDSDGRIDLTRLFPGLTPKDLAYIRWRDDGSFTAMFPTYYGEGSQIAGLLYTSRPLQDGDTHLRESATNFAQQQIGVGTYENLLLEKQINPNWYHVTYHMR
jgi:hypothetical protein